MLKDIIKFALLFIFVKGPAAISHSSTDSHHLDELCSAYVRKMQRTEHQKYGTLARTGSQNNDDCAPSVATIQVAKKEPFVVSCDWDIDGPGWTVIQRRIHGNVDFYRNWTEYKEGFGDVEGDFWIGLEKLHLMTTSERYVLVIRLVDQNDEIRYARYNNFVVAGENERYLLHVIGIYTGDAGDSLSSSIGRHFSTYDHNHDGHRLNCAKDLKGGWWYFHCGDSNLNGKNFDCKMEHSNLLEKSGCIFWKHWHGRSYSLKSVQMMIRPGIRPYT